MKENVGFRSFNFSTIPNHSGDMPEGTLKAILIQSGVSIDEFLNS